MSDGGLRERFYARLRFANKSALTIAQYARKLASLNEYLVKNHSLSLDTPEHVKAITGLILEEYQMSLRNSGMTDVTEYSHVTAIRAYFSWLVRVSIVDSNKNPAGALERLKVVAKEQPHFAWGEAEKMIQQYHSRNELRDLAIMGIALTMGLRVSSIAKLNVIDIGLQTKQLAYINKGGALKHTHLPDEILSIILRYLKEERGPHDSNDPLFVSERGNRISVDAIQNICKNAGRIIGKKCTPHSMRRTCLSRVAEIQGDDLAQLMGAHSDKRTTARYIYTTAEEMDDVYSKMGLLSFEEDEKM